MMRTHLLLACVLLVPTASAQWETVKNRDLGVSYKMPKKWLSAVPLNPAQPVPHLEDQWITVKPVYGKAGSYQWAIKVYRFVLASDDGGTPTTGSGEEKPSDPEKMTDQQRLALMKAGRYKSFASWLDKSPENKGATMKIDGKDDKQRRGDKLTYKWYEWVHGSNGIEWLHVAASYDLDGRQIALVAHFPEDMKNRYYSAVRDSLTSLGKFEGGGVEIRKVEGEEYVKLDPEVRRKLLDAQITELEKLKEWEIFCTPNYIVLYSFDQSSDRKAKAKKFAKDIASNMEEMRAEYERLFPPHKDVKKWWSVLRVCRDEKEFQRYGSSSPGVIGWFSPSSKELVIFDARKLGQFSTETVAYHEGWHQYAHFWFPGAELHRWFDEGMGDYFGSMKRLGRSRWKPEDSRMRKVNIKELINTDKTVPLRDIVSWHKDKFYGAGAANFYAQGWAMVDFFLRGKGGHYWDKSWDGIFDTYIKTALESKDTKKAVEDAFKGVDWNKLEESWKKYVKSL